MTWLIRAQRRGWCAACCRGRTSPVSTPSPRVVIWWTASLPRSHRTPGSCSPGTPSRNSCRHWRGADRRNQHPLPALSPLRHPGFRALRREMHTTGAAAGGVQRADYRNVPMRRHDEHHEPAAARARHLAADRPRGESEFVELLDPPGTDARRGLLLRLPGPVQDGCHAADLAAQQRLLHLDRVVLELVQTVDRIAVNPAHAPLLLDDDRF